MNVVLIKLISQKNLYIAIIIPSYLILLSYFIYFSQATSIVMRCGCNGPFGIQIEGGFPIEKEKEKKRRELSYQNDNFSSTQITSEEKIKNKTKTERKNSKITEKKKENRNINEMNNIQFPSNQLQPKLKGLK